MAIRIIFDVCTASTHGITHPRESEHKLNPALRTHTHNTFDVIRSVNVDLKNTHIKVNALAGRKSRSVLTGTSSNEPCFDGNFSVILSSLNVHAHSKDKINI